jgi:hypothetical protein
MNRAEELINKVRKFWDSAQKGKQDGWEVALLVTLPTGMARVENLLWMNETTLLLNIRPDEEHPAILFLPIEQAAFLIEQYRPEKSEESRVVVGFGKADLDG